MRSARRRLAWIMSVLCLMTLLPAAPASADNPIVQTIYTADPAPLVHNGRVYLYTGHDEDGSTYFTMRDWRVYSSTDMANWTDHGSPMSLATFSWADANAWARPRRLPQQQVLLVRPGPPALHRPHGHRRGRRRQPDRAVQRRAGPPAGRQQRDRPQRHHRRRRPGLPVLGQSPPRVRPPEQRHDLLLGRDQLRLPHRRRFRRAQRQRPAADPLRGGALGLQAGQPLLQRVRRRVLLGVHRLLHGSECHRAVDVSGNGHAPAGRQLHQPRRCHRLPGRVVLLLPQRRAAGRQRLHQVGGGGEVHLQLRRHHPDDQHDRRRTSSRWGR